MYNKYFLKSLEMPLINLKVKSKLRWWKHCVLSVLGNENDNDNEDPSIIVFTIKDTKLYVPVVTLSAKDNKKLSNFLAKDLKDRCNWMNIKQKLGIKMQQTGTAILLNRTFRS